MGIDHGQPVIEDRQQRNGAVYQFSWHDRRGATPQPRNRKWDYCGRRLLGVDARVTNESIRPQRLMSVRTGSIASAVALFGARGPQQWRTPTHRSADTAPVVTLPPARRSLIAFGAMTSLSPRPTTSGLRSSEGRALPEHRGNRAASPVSSVRPNRPHSRRAQSGRGRRARRRSAGPGQVWKTAGRRGR